MDNKLANVLLMKVIKYIKGDMHMKRWLFVTGLLLAVAAVVVSTSGMLGTAVLAPAASVTHSKACAAAKAEIAKIQPGWGSEMSCAKAIEFVSNLPNPSAPAAPKTGYVLKSAPPLTIPNAGKVILFATNGNVGQDIQLMGPEATSITAAWSDVDSNDEVSVFSGETSDPTRGLIVIKVSDGVGFNPRSINGYSGGSYTVPGSTGPVTLTSVTGSISGGNMAISFKEADGATGSLLPETGSFSGGA